MKIFAVSDIHGYYDEFITALNESGFSPNDSNHLLVCCGDYFDRGNYPHKIRDYLMSISNKILIRGNHEDLMQQVLQRGYPLTHDVHNGTERTCYQLLKHDWNTCKFDANLLWQSINPFYNQMVDFFETKHYIFVHGWIPVTVNDNYPSYYTKHRRFEFNPDWRTGDWSQARWLSPIDMAKSGFIIPNKTIVCGHWHCSYGHHLDKGTSEFGTDAIWSPYEASGICAIDACTVHTKKVNIKVIEDDLIEAIK